ncbi:unnamed protein product [Alopecurus aequalis]
MSQMQRGNRNDRLSRLPDDILLNVLDRLNVPNAARTSVLSKRWRRLPAMLSRLTISVLDFLPHNGPIFENDEVVRSNRAVTEATNILARRDATRNTIHLLSITFFLKDGDPLSIGRAVAQTMATHKVEMAEFTIMTEKDASQCDDDNIASYGKQFILFFDACTDSFSGLTRLHLENLRFGESGINSVLIVCMQLKDLRVFNCDSGDTPTLQVDHPQISDLSIIDCPYGQVFLNWLPKLTRMTFEGWSARHDPLSIRYAPSLEAFNLANIGLSSHEMVELSKFLRGTSVRDLKLGFKCEKIWVQPECLTKRLSSVFCQLRFVNLDEIPEGYELTWALFILKAAPLLKKLYMTVWDHFCKMETDDEKRKALSYSDNKGVEWESSASDFKHDSLVMLTIFGFQSEDYMVRFIRHVMEAAVNLEEVFLYHRLACRKCRDHPQKPLKFPFTKRQRTSVKKRITDGFDSFPVIRFPTAAGIRADHLAKLKYPIECSGFASRRYTGPCG